MFLIKGIKLLAALLHLKLPGFIIKGKRSLLPKITLPSRCTHPAKFLHELVKV